MSHLSPKQAAQELGVSESSVKRWCDLGTVPVIRTAGGHRRIPRVSLEKLLAQVGKSPGATVAQMRAGQIAAAEIDLSFGFAGSLVEFQTAFHDALRLGAARSCRNLLHGLMNSGQSSASAADALITHAMHQFGHLWEQGDLAVYQERRACGICLGLLHELKLATEIPAVGPIAIGGSPRGDIYQLPSQLVELALAERGWLATSLGCNLPLTTFLDAVREYRPRLLWISLSTIEGEDEFVEEFNHFAGMLDQETALIIGGRAANDALRPRLRYTAHCDSLAHLGDLASALVAER